jgi:thiol-disulfide isomerase/thioredoxin
MKLKKSHINNIITIIFIAVLIIPQTRKPIQVTLNSIVALFGPSVNSEKNANKLSEYQWQLLDQQGDPFNFESAKGNVVFVNLWATWCPPCIAEMPSMNKLYQDYSKEVIFLFVTNEDMSRVQNFLVQKELDLPVFNSVTEPPKDLASKSLPTTYVIGKDSKIYVDKVGAANWNSDGVRKLLDELIAK